METLQKNKSLIAIVLVFVAGLLVYNYFKPDIAPDAGPAQIIGADLVELSTSLQSVALDQSLLSTAIYRSLADFSIEILPQPTGRVNPFASLGQD